MSPLWAAQSTPVNRTARLDPRQLNIQMTRAPQRNPHRNNNNNNNNNNGNGGGEHYSFTVQPPNGPTMRLRVNLNVIAVDREPSQPRVEVRPAVVADEAEAGENTARTTRSSRLRKKSVCNHALDRKFCSKCHIRRRHLNRWWLRHQYRQH